MNKNKRDPIEKECHADNTNKALLVKITKDYIEKMKIKRMKRIMKICAAFIVLILVVKVSIVVAQIQ